MRIRFQEVPLNRGAVATEHRDCTVRAFATACNAPYEDVHAVLASWGRQPGRGMKLSELRDRTEILGRPLTKLEIGIKPTLAAVMYRMHTGRYFVVKTGHAFAVVNGVVLDTGKIGARSRIYGIWRVEEPLQAQPATVHPVDLLPAPPAVIPPTVPLPWIVARYLQLRAGGEVLQAVSLFTNATPKMQQLMMQEVRKNG